LTIFCQFFKGFNRLNNLESANDPSKFIHSQSSNNSSSARFSRPANFTSSSSSSSNPTNPPNASKSTRANSTSQFSLEDDDEEDDEEGCYTSSSSAASSTLLLPPCQSTYNAINHSIILHNKPHQFKSEAPREHSHYYSNSSSVAKIKRMLHDEPSNNNQSVKKHKEAESKNGAFLATSNRLEVKQYLIDMLKAKAHDIFFKNCEWIRNDLARVDMRLQTIRMPRIANTSPAVRDIHPQAGHDAPFKYVVRHFALLFEERIKNAHSLVSALLDTCSPKLSRVDKTLLLRNSFFMVSMLQSHKLMIDGESYAMADEGRLQMTRHWLNRIMGKEQTDFLFKFAERIRNAEITDRELALLIPCVVTLSTPRKLYHKILIDT
jgi:hypothetical protein